MSLGCNLPFFLDYLSYIFNLRTLVAATLPSLPLPKTPSPHTLHHRRSSDRASIAVRVIHDSHHGVPLFFPSQLAPPSTRSSLPFTSNDCETVSALSLRRYLHLGRCDALVSGCRFIDGVRVVAVRVWRNWEVGR
ncbi:hypothetical protein GQ457_14G002650 [Hibiscus cannabinus]